MTEKDKIVGIVGIYEFLDTIAETAAALPAGYSTNAFEIRQDTIAGFHRKRSASRYANARSLMSRIGTDATRTPCLRSSSLTSAIAA